MDNDEFRLLSEAAKNSEHLSETIETYLMLRRMLAESSPDVLNFRNKFSRYYGLNAAGLTPEWKDKYFQLLFSFQRIMPEEPHRAALLELFPLKTTRRNKTLQFSFVSKLVAIHDEYQPLFDRYVQSYFGLGAPSLMALPEFRISGFIQNLNEIRSRYVAWSVHPPFAEILDDLRNKYFGKTNCHSVRICDFLVWSIGKKYRQ